MFSLADLVLQSNSDHNNMKGPLYLDIRDKNTVGVHHRMGEGDFKRLVRSLTRVIIGILLFCFSEAAVALRYHSLRMLKTFSDARRRTSWKKSIEVSGKGIDSETLIYNHSHFLCFSVS